MPTKNEKAADGWADHSESRGSFPDSRRHCPEYAGVVHLLYGSKESTLHLKIKGKHPIPNKSKTSYSSLD